LKKILDTALSLVTLIAPIPTGWAVYAGLSVRDAWPMPGYIAIPGSVALVAVSISVSSYIIDVNSFNKSLRRADRTGERAISPINTMSGWMLLTLATLSEITLALLVSIVPGLRTYAVLAFPLLTGAGIFTFVLRVQLAEKVTERDKQRIDRKANKEMRVQPEKNAPAKKSGANAKGKNASHVRKGFPDACPHCGIHIRTSAAWSAHSGRWCPVLHPRTASLDTTLVNT